MQETIVSVEQSGQPLIMAAPVTGEKPSKQSDELSSERDSSPSKKAEVAEADRNGSEVCGCWLMKPTAGVKGMVYLTLGVVVLTILAIMGIIVVLSWDFKLRINEFPNPGYGFSTVAERKTYSFVLNVMAASLWFLMLLTLTLMSLIHNSVRNEPQNPDQIIRYYVQGSLFSVLTLTIGCACVAFNDMAVPDIVLCVDLSLLAFCIVLFMIRNIYFCQNRQENTGAYYADSKVMLVTHDLISQ